MKQLLSIVILLIILSACTSQKIEYDIDVSCPQDLFSYLGENTVARYTCDESIVNNFTVRCTKESVQIINGIIYCLSVDKKMIRIQITP